MMEKRTRARPLKVDIVWLELAVTMIIEVGKALMRWF